LHRVIAIHQKSRDIQSREPFLFLHIFHTPSCCYPHNLKAQCTHASHLLYRSPCFKRRHSHTLNCLPPSRIIKTHRITTTNRLPQNHRRNFTQKKSSLCRNKTSKPSACCNCSVPQPNDRRENTRRKKKKKKKGGGFEEGKGEGAGLELRRRWMATREGEGSACSVEGAFIHKSQGAWGYPAKNRAGSWKVCQPLLRLNGNKLVGITAKMLRTCWGNNT